jgi:hypothetical protein
MQLSKAAQYEGVNGDSGTSPIYIYISIVTFSTLKYVEFVTWQASIGYMW